MILDTRKKVSFYIYFILFNEFIGFGDSRLNGECRQLPPTAKIGFIRNAG